jgi:F-type H+-transporting ATPase subunit gamma
MASLKEIRTRISSVVSTRQITSAMKMVSAAKLKKAQDNILMMRPYANKLQEILATLSENDNNDSDNPYIKQRNVEKVLIVVVNSNRGLCGAFNANAIKMGLQLASEKYEKALSKGNVTFLPIGRKAAEFFTKKNFQVIKENYNTLLDSASFENTAPSAKTLIELFLNGTYDVIEIVYNQFKNAAVQITTAEQFLPIVKKAKDKDSSKLKPVQYNFILEPSEEHIIRELIPKSLKIQFHKTLLESVASEHGARMTAMHKATDNASEIIKDLKLLYNKARQASITKEILEIVSGAEALNG